MEQQAIGHSGRPHQGISPTRLQSPEIRENRPDTWPVNLTSRFPESMRKTCRYAAAALLTVAAATPVLADPPIDAQQHCAVTSPEQARWAAEQLFEHGAYQSAGACYQAAGDLTLANLAFLKAVGPEGNAAERRLTEQRDQAKALLRQVQQSLR